MAQVMLDQVSKTYPNGHVAVHGMDLDIADGEFLVLVGPSGCGKSTLLRMIAGLESITGGELRIGDRVVNDVHPGDRDIAMVFQNYALYPHYTVARNIAYPLRLAKRPKDEIDRRVREVAAMLELTDYLDRKPGQLSGGQRQRVAMGRAIIRDAALFLMDEPLSNLDAKLRVQMRGEIARLQRRVGTTMVYVTHDQVEAMTMGHRVAVLKEGRLQQIGTPDEIYRSPANTFVASFMGTPPMNLVEARLRTGKGGTEVVLGGVDVPLPAAERGYPEGPVTVGVRPEHLLDASILGDTARHVRIPAIVEYVEALGAEKNVYVTLGAIRGDATSAGAPIACRFPAESAVVADAKVELALDPARIHLFDAESGAALR
ncbi:ABC transporter ATP-binding protein [Embleya scabrispora]|uniref:ABC transporter ATP-binding protein n=1 Tax=Embleya scabrispora TaxID=159449 RepID=UPI0003777098|nr:sn-glycerol-3-phosphate ABC transporter ATP-binding protein UgpC [Embleya scabrispora]MYS85372.1 sn-glycerol-3-phosphate ABC transporter ATP-binding protein UgpC [Streptomyces sp. SID5474]